MAWARQRWNPRAVPAVAAACALVFLAYPVGVATNNGPFYSLYLNAFGFGRTGYYFPHDEMNDMGLRPAIERICETAPYGARVGGEAEPVFKYYFHKYGRDDLQYFDLSDSSKAPRLGICISGCPRRTEVLREYRFRRQHRVAPGAHPYRENRRS